VHLAKFLKDLPMSDSSTTKSNVETMSHKANAKLASIKVETYTPETQATKISTETENNAQESSAKTPEQTKKEIGGRGGLEPTRFGDWEKNGRCIDF